MNPFTTLRKKQRFIALFFLSAIAVPEANAFANKSAAPAMAPSMGAPVAASASQYVDPFTGDFNYSVPLLTVPGPNGENVPVTASYHAGIRMNQSASWLGLGWDYNPGEISRSVMGTHDDSRGGELNANLTLTTIPTYVSSPFLPRLDTFEYNSIYGAMYYDSINKPLSWPSSLGAPFIEHYTKSHDAYNYFEYFSSGIATSTHLSGNQARFQDFDQYAVSGPGIGGELKPYLNQEFTLKVSVTSSVTISQPANMPTLQFNFENSSELNATPSGTSTIETTTNHYKNGYFIKYYTNDQINNSSNLFSNTTQTGFLDFREVSGTRRPTGDFEQYGIGGFEVATPSGITYHYSLPVYTGQEISTDFYINSGVPDMTREMTINKRNFKAASSWKLTAVTGSDYEDSNGNKTVDEGDKGYWIAYDYALWTREFLYSPNIAGYSTGKFSNKVPAHSIYYGVNKVHLEKGSTFIAKKELYYLNTIKTSTHTAFFVKENRLDEYSFHKTMFAQNPIPQLKLSKIVLLKNEDASLFTNAGTFSQHSSFDYSECFIGDSKLVHTGKYSANQSSIDASSLKTVEFDNDYKLCRNYFNNINTSVSGLTSTTFANYTQVRTNLYKSLNFDSDYFCKSYADFDDLTVTSSSYNMSGKLSLNKISVFENGKTAVFPSYVFNYLGNNPDYDPMKEDIWGYYKSDFDYSDKSNYTTPQSKDSVDAWSLEKITTPLGGEIEMTYESDRYSSEGGAVPSFLFLVSGMTSLSGAGGGTVLLSSSVIGKDLEQMVLGSSIYSYEVYSPYYYNCGVGTPAILDYFAFSDAYMSMNSGPGKRTFSITGYNHSMSNHRPSYTCLIAADESATNYNPASYGYAYIKAKTAMANGGGIRVKKIVIHDPESDEKYEENFEYAGGYTDSKPNINVYDNWNKYSDGDFSLKRTSAYVLREGVKPGVGYSTVTISSKGKYNENTGKVVLEFHAAGTGAKRTLTSVASTPLRRTGCRDAITQIDYYYYEYEYNFTNEIDLSNHSFFGKLKKKSVYDANDNLIAYTKNYYKTGNTFRETFQGEPVPRTWLAPNVTRPCGPFSPKRIKTYITKTRKIKATCFLEASESFSNGILTKQIINARDPATGQPLSTTVIDPTQGALTSEVKLAYANTSDYSDLGLKSGCSTCEDKKNLLGLTEEQKVIRRPVYRDAYGVLAFNANAAGNLVSASKQSYTKDVSQRNYNTGTNRYETTAETVKTYLPDETFAALTTSTTSSTVTPEWKKTNKITLYNSHNKALESEGMSGRKSAVKYGYHSLYPLSSISDASYNCFGFSSFEDTLNVGSSGSPVWHFGGETDHGHMQVPANPFVTPHTGYYMAAVPASEFGPGMTLQGYEKGRSYRASVWVHKSSPDNASLALACDGSVGGAATYLWEAVAKNDPANITVGDWILMSVQLTIPENFVETGGTHNNSLGVSVWNLGGSTAYYDDLMLRPVDAPITGTVYDPHTGRVIATLDNENFASWFEYDAAGRVTSTYTETRLGIKKISETQYHFSRAGQ
jgi:YD repeat-containing protein